MASPVYNINNSNLIYYYPFDINYLDYKTGAGVSNLLSTTGTSISTTTTKLTSGSLLMPGVNTEIIQTPNTTFTTNGVTFAVWMKCNTIPTQTHRIFDFGSGAGVQNTGLYFSDSNGTLLILAYNPSIGTTANYGTGYVLTDLNWHHYCLTFTPTGVTQVYVDGVAKSVTATIYPNLSTLTTCFIGRSDWADDVTTNGSINAYFNQFLLFNRVITSPELSNLVNRPSLVQFSGAASGVSNPCFLQGSKILHFDPITNTESYVPVETLQKGTLIKTFMSGYKPVSHIGFKTHDNPADAPDVRDRLYGLSHPEFEPLYLTGRHSVLRNDLSEKEINILRENMGDVYVTENHYRVPIFLDGRAKPYTDNAPVTIWHFALEHPDIYQNYGVMANGILVESSSAEYMTDHSNMELL